MKKLLTLTLVAALLLTSALPAFAEMAAMPNGEFPLVTDGYEMDILIPQTEIVIDYNTNDMTKKMEALTGVKINWDIVADPEQTKSLLLASGDLPDIFAVNMSNAEQVMYGDLGAFIDLTPLIEEHGQNIKAMFDYDSRIREEITLPSGAIVSLPAVSYTYHMTAANKMWINRNWLKAVDMAVPTTLDELYNVMVAFRDKDPNGNGQADEIPASGYDVNGWNSVIPYLMSSFITTDGTAGRYFMQPYEGAVDVVFDKPEWKEGLLFLNKLYNEKLIDPESFTQDSALRKQKVEANTVGIAFSNAPSNYAVADSEAFMSFDAVAPVAGPSGTPMTADTTTAVIAGFATITAACERPDIALRWLDVLYDEDVNLDNIMGNQGVEWRYGEEGELGINGKPAIWANLPAYTGVQQNASWSQGLPSFRTSEWRLGEVGAAREDILLRAAMETRLYEATNLYTPYKSDVVVPINLYISPENNDEYADIKTALYDYMYEATARFITGSMDIESEWDAYLAELDKIGLKRYLELVQEAITPAGA